MSPLGRFGFGPAKRTQEEKLPSMPINQLHRTLQRLLLQLRPAERKTRIRNWSRLLVGLCLSRSVHLSKIANKIPTKATLPSATRRLSRLLDNAAIRARDW